MKTLLPLFLLLMLGACSDLAAPDPVSSLNTSEEHGLTFRSEDADADPLCPFVCKGVVNFESGHLEVNGASFPLVSDTMSWSVNAPNPDGTALSAIQIITPGFHAWCRVKLTPTGPACPEEDLVYSIVSSDMDGVLTVLFEVDYWDCFTTGELEFRLESSEPFL